MRVLKFNLFGTVLASAYLGIYINTRVDVVIVEKQSKFVYGANILFFFIASKFFAKKFATQPQHIELQVFTTAKYPPCSKLHTL